MSKHDDYLREVREWDYSSLLDNLQNEKDPEFLAAVKQVWEERGYR